MLGPAILGRFGFATTFVEATRHQQSVLNFVYWLGLQLLMFLSGAETRNLFSRAFDAGIISAEFYTTQVLAAILTSQAAGVWLDSVLRKGCPLLTPVATGAAAVVSSRQTDPLPDIVP